MTTDRNWTERIRPGFGALAPHGQALLLACGLAGFLLHAAAAAEVTPPASIASAGKIVYCSDISGPPLGYFDENNNPIGSDIDLGKEIAKRMGVTAEFANTPFDGIIPA